MKKNIFILFTVLCLMSCDENINSLENGFSEKVEVKSEELKKTSAFSILNQGTSYKKIYPENGKYLFILPSEKIKFQWEEFPEFPSPKYYCTGYYIEINNFSQKLSSYWNNHFSVSGELIKPGINKWQIKAEILLNGPGGLIFPEYDNMKEFTFINVYKDNFLKSKNINGKPAVDWTDINLAYLAKIYSGNPGWGMSVEKSFDPNFSTYQTIGFSWAHLADYVIDNSETIYDGVGPKKTVYYRVYWGTFGFQAASKGYHYSKVISVEVKQ